MKIQFSGDRRPQKLLAWLDRLPLSAVIPAGIVLGCGIGGAGFVYLEAPGWAVAWLALFAALGWLGYTATPVFDEPNPVQAAKPARPRPVRDGSLLMVDLPGGRFLMGSPDSDDLARSEEKPQHEVTVAPFRIAITPVTVELYREVMLESSSSGREADVRWPATNVSWLDAVEFCNRLSERTGYRPCYTMRFGGWHSRHNFGWHCDWSAGGYRLPTEAEWEYACRAGTASRYHFGDDPAGLDRYAWYNGNTNTLQPIATRNANPWGLYDMNGNVWEWCWDWYESYSRELIHDPHGPEKTITGQGVLRGGSFGDPPENLRSAFRVDVGVVGRHRVGGFRCVRVPPRQID